MAGIRSSFVTVSCSNHHQALVTKLWDFFRTNHGTDMSFLSDGRMVQIHQLLVDVFLSQDKLVETAQHAGRCSLDSLLEFLYTGTVRVRRDSLDSLLEVAHKLDFNILVGAVESARDVIPPLNDRMSEKMRSQSPTSKIVLDNEARRKGESGSDSDNLALECVEAWVNHYGSDAEDDSDQERGASSPKHREDGAASMSTPSGVVEVESAESLKDETGEEIIDEADQCQAPTVEQWAEHKVQERAKQQHICGECGLACPSASRLARHATTHTCKFQCNQCEMAYPRKSDLRRHVKTTHTAARPYVCKICKKSFPRVHSLNIHVITHTGQRSFICHICGKAFYCSSHLQGHIRTHSTDRPHVCEECGKAFATRTQLRMHAQRHAGIKPFKCSSCPRAFGEKQTLLDHLRTHTGERPFKCDLCPKDFRHRAALTVHIRSHTGERPYKCQHCPKAFSHGGALIDHVRSHTGQKRFECDVCHRGFKHKHLLADHIPTHTN